jgi:hypothetical protein
MSLCLNLSNSRDHKSSRRSSPLLAPKVRLDGESRKGETRVVAAANALCRREPRGNEHNATLPKEQPSWRGLQRGAPKYFSLRGHGPYDAKSRLNGCYERDRQREEILVVFVVIGRVVALADRYNSLWWLTLHGNSLLPG